MLEENSEDIISEEELERITDNARNAEEEGMKNTLKYFDRIHDKIFTFNNILIAGYFFLVKIENNVSIYIILLPLLNLAFIIYIEYRMMEKSRIQSNTTNISFERLKKSNKAQNRTNQYSLLIIFTTALVAIFFLYRLFTIN